MVMQKSRRQQVPPQRHRNAVHQVRIIGGKWKRTSLAVVEIESLRPTPDRVRETAFNWLTHLLQGQWNEIVCLDLFAGTGALGFEAASRGAASVVMVEENLSAVRQLEATKLKLNAEQVSIQRGNALSLLQKWAAGVPNGQPRFNLIFLDPPYHQDWLAKILPLCRQLLVDGGMVYAEAEVPLTKDIPVSWMADWDVIRADKAGMVCYHLLQCNKADNFQA